MRPDSPPPPPSDPGPTAAPLPSPALPPSRRGDWNHAAVTNVLVTELVKRHIGTVTRPWNK